MDCKRLLADRLIAALAGFHENRKRWENEDVDEILTEGSKKARKVAQETMKEVREAMYMSYG